MGQFSINLNKPRRGRIIIYFSVTLVIGVQSLKNKFKNALMSDNFSEHKIELLNVKNCMNLQPLSCLCMKKLKNI